MSDTLVYFLGSVFLIWFGYGLVKTGVTAIRTRDKGVGPLDPRMGLLTGIICMLSGVAFLVKFVLLPLLAE